MTFLVDTNVISELVRPSPDTRVLAWVETLETFAISVITLEEIAFGLAVKPNARIQRSWDTLVETFCQVLDVTPPIARHAGILRGQLTASGRPRTQADMFIAATAAQHGLTLVTRNERDFSACGIAVVNPFARQAPPR